MHKNLSLLLLSFLSLSLSAQLCVASYNIRYNRNDDASHGNGWQTRCPVMCNQLLFLQPDILGVQEAYADQLADMLALMPGYQSIGVAREDGKQKGEHSAILYRTDRFELMDSGNFWLSETPDRPSLGWDAACVRICTWGRFRDRLTGQQLCLFNLHMDHVGTVARRESARLVMQHIDSLAHDTPTILTGDFNVDQTDEIHSLFTQSGLLRDTYDSARVRFAENGTFNSFHPERKTTSRIDHILVTRQWQVDRYGILTDSYWQPTGNHDPQDRPIHERRNISDHYPVVVYLQ